MSRVVSIVLLACLVVGLLPAPGYASVVVDGGTLPPGDAGLYLLGERYGYTDEGLTIGALATDLGLTQRQTAALVVLADTYATGGNPAARGTVGATAGLAKAMHAYMIRSGSWDSFSSSVAGMSEIGSEFVLNAGGLWDFLGFDSFADARSWANAGGWVSGLRDIYTPWPFPYRVVPTPEELDNSTTWDAQTIANAIGVVKNSGYPVKVYSPRWEKSYSGGEVSAEFIRADSYTQAQYKCFACGVQWTVAASNYSYVSWAAPGTFCAFGSAPPIHDCEAMHESEAAYSLRSAVESGTLPAFLKIAADAITNPGHLVASLLDGYGVPGFLPPGALHDSTVGFQDFGGGLAAQASKLASDAAGLPLGFREIAEGLAAVMNWVADVWRAFAETLYSLFLPSPDFTAVILPRWKGELEGALRDSVMGIIFLVGDALGDLSGQSSGDYLDVDLSLPGGHSLSFDVGDAVDVLVPFRGFFTGALYFVFLVFVFRWVKPLIGV